MDKVAHRVGSDIVIQLHFDDAACLHFDGGYGYFCNHDVSSESIQKMGYCRSKSRFCGFADAPYSPVFAEKSQ
jgi:hypothetical protein